jgi:hypothetical protein
MVVQNKEPVRQDIVEQDADVDLDSVAHSDENPNSQIRGGLFCDSDNNLTEVESDDEDEDADDEMIDGSDRV